ncbi:MAG: cell envelope integrity protein TolA [Gammaproteobacteria bacterium]|nr:cell envelope integrity protein TolA [Gammaproteobacteria bacterium]
MAKGPLYLPRSAFIAIIVHVVVFSLFIFGYQMKPKVSQALVDPINIVKAEVIDGETIEQEKKKIRDEQELRERKKREEEQRKKREAEEKKRQQEEAKKREEEKRQAEINKAKEEKRKAEEKAQKEAEARKKAELEKQKAEEAKKKAEQERIKAEENAKKLAEELKKQEEAKRRAEEEAEQKRLEAILEQEEAEIRAEEERAAKAARQRELNTLLSQYIGAITSKVQSKWRKPPSMESTEAECVVYVVQAVGGYIEKVEVQKCRGGDEQFRKSVEEAVWKSDPLPAPTDDELFQRELKITFRPR